MIFVTMNKESKFFFSRKGQATIISGKVLVEMIIFVIIFFIFMKLGAKVWQFYVSKPQTVTENSFDLLTKHIEYFDDSFSNSFPLQIDEAHIIKGFDKTDTTKPNMCIPQDKSCLCICKSTCDSENLVKCQSLDFDNDIRLNNDFLVQGEENIKNYVLELDDQKRIKISLEII
jgi:hypothetical protein